ncbi:TPA: DUF2786 domain-containing protein [Enterococcus faecium]|uniref:Uncharacterized protein n=5 Tax=Enterococcus TaxID=1350 RepID=A0A286KC97_ENTAV|nr:MULTISPECIES: DUF2786 domain-containing protein [Enterococcus]APB62452.1 hypothetical protein pEMA120_p41 [Enterococcus faecium]APB62540.1 hypothetical protein pEA19081_p44 [Enterococcus avium]EOF89257.1 hypothetical protein SKG_02713 [Enterococcus faecium EnGen0166]EOH41961.1 hypothetical protein SSI_03017 [Enterococcus faecium EnGen0191]EOM17968.1 hypothetical protein SSM_03081 [Enterococcus faecium EnGen0192]
MNGKKYAKIVKKVKGLLAIAKDENKDEESQSAFLMAQRLMIQYDIDKADVLEEGEEAEPIGEESVTVYKKLFWWERTLGQIIAKNFRVKMFYNSKRKNGDQRKKSKVVFYGFGKDLELAKEMYILAYEVLLYHSQKYINRWYEDEGIARERYLTESIKSSYIRGFLGGLEARFEEQVAILTKRYEVMVLIPKEVEESYKDYSKEFGVYNSKIPPVTVGNAYSRGYEEAKKVDFTQKTVGTDYSSLVDRYIRFNEGGTRGLIAEVISISENQLNLLIMNTVSSGFSTSNPCFYSWVIHAEHDFELLHLTDDSVRLFIDYKNNNNYKKQIAELITELR